MRPQRVRIAALLFVSATCAESAWAQLRSSEEAIQAAGSSRSACCCSISRCARVTRKAMSSV